MGEAGEGADLGNAEVVVSGEGCKPGVLGSDNGSLLAKGADESDEQIWIKLYELAGMWP